MNIHVTLTFDDETNLDADRAAPDLFFDAERAHDRVHARASVIATRRETHSRNFHSIGHTYSFGLETFALNPRASPFHRAIQNVRQRLIDHADDAAPFN